MTSFEKRLGDAFGCPGCGRPWDVPGTDPILCPTCWLILTRPPGRFCPGAAPAGSLSVVATESQVVVAAGVRNAGAPEARRLLRQYRRGLPRATLAAARLIAVALRLTGTPRSCEVVAPLYPRRDDRLAGLVAAQLGLPTLRFPGALTSSLKITDVWYKGTRSSATGRGPIIPVDHRLAVLVNGWHR